jgi:hypothetical protein
LREQVRQRAERELHQYLNPFIGGPERNGWPFGRALRLAEISGVLQRIVGVEFVDEIQISTFDPSDATALRPAPPRLDLPHHAVICSDNHQITVR